MAAMENFNPLRDAVPVGEIKRALVIKLRHHGDVLVSSPVFSVSSPWRRWSGACRPQVTLWC